MSRQSLANPPSSCFSWAIFNLIEPNSSTILAEGLEGFEDFLQYATHSKLKMKSRENISDWLTEIGQVRPRTQLERIIGEAKLKKDESLIQFLQRVESAAISDGMTEIQILNDMEEFIRKANQSDFFGLGLLGEIYQSDPKLIRGVIESDQFKKWLLSKFEENAEEVLRIRSLVSGSPNSIKDICLKPHYTIRELAQNISRRNLNGRFIGPAADNSVILTKLISHSVCYTMVYSVLGMGVGLSSKIFGSDDDSKK